MNTSVAPSRNPLALLVVFHLLVIAASNYLVQIPVSFGSVTTTWGAFTFPLIFLATDLTVRLYGAAVARKIIFFAMLPALVVSYVFSVIFYQGEFQGLAPLLTFNSFVGRIALASLLAYLIGQLLDVKVFGLVRQHFTQRWWVAPAVSTVIGGLVDTLVFFGVAFYQSSDAFMAANWPEIATVDYAVKLLVSLLIFVPAYGVAMRTLAAWFMKNQALNA
ncbi:MAG: 7-cyano-7-deazaguanine/7-aminomethyl-7-deazaguanine transporter [Thiofilum sp.]|uniref:7-cyano-7-deazaguanine/7-aminomethyl-7- deazaguanine transporter n=1 Tax=Thiofilum sp. TaxID=2212733 RepID=UPI0025FA7B6B|nr:7-cyano-7-deazaguanine/7-aminomethyl-7-deazaguanine transporter [Thiofilum sp.]MBK8454639.1 7-cyano-7-deazaguanine/7-aminomethyl-7-deazaguanine transporter [Thiofilum sp.]